jgi:hypothetical protein
MARAHKSLLIYRALWLDALIYDCHCTNVINSMKDVTTSEIGNAKLLIYKVNVNFTLKFP